MPPKSKKNSFSSPVRRRRSSRKRSVKEAKHVNPSPDLHRVISLIENAALKLEGREYYESDVDEESEWGDARFDDSDSEEESSAVRGSTNPRKRRPLFGLYGAGVLGLLLAIASGSLALLVEVLEPYTDLATERVSVIVVTLLLILSVPITHGHGMRRYASFQFWQPFLGGFNFVLFQAVGWTLYGCTIALCLYMIYEGSTFMFSIIGVTGVLSQLVVLGSLHFFTAAETAKQPTSQPTKSLARQIDDALPWHGLGNVGLVFSLVSCLIGIIIESTSIDKVHAFSLGTLATTAIIVAVPLTHVLAGPAMDPNYRNWQPFKGGGTFVLLQAMSWTLWALTVLVALYQLYIGYQHHEIHLNGLITSTGIFGVASQMLILVSLKFFDSTLTTRLCGQATTGEAAEGVTAPTPRSIIALSSQDWSRGLKYTRDSVIVVFLYAAPTIGIVLVAGHFYALYALEWGWALFLFSFTAYSFTFKPAARVTGSRSWDWFRNNMRVWSAFENYFSFELVPHGTLNPDKLYLMGFHPHGIVPCTAFWATRGAQWRQHYPDVTVDVCGASVIFFAPVLRDFMSWAGGRDVSKKAIRCALIEHKRSLVIVPGGQREMNESTSDSKTLRLYKKHKGFVRIALKCGASLVPILSFGEDQILHNVHAPKMQSYTLKKFGVAFPFYMFGRLYTPIPNNVKVTVVVGDPIDLPAKPMPNPPEELVTELHEQYYLSVRKLFEQHKAAAGYPDCELTFVG